MTEKMIENRIKKLQAIEAQREELEEAAEAIRAELKADLEQKGVDELKTPNFLIRWKEIMDEKGENVFCLVDLLQEQVDALIDRAGGLRGNVA